MIKVVYFGTPEFSASVLKYLLDSGISICAVISKPDKPKGRSGDPVPTPVKIIAQNSIPVYQPDIVSNIEFTPIIQALEPDLFVVVAYGEIIKQHLLDIPKLGSINLHTSLLPKYRGAAPIQRAIINGETESGISIIHMVKKMDAGNVIKMIKVPIQENETFGDLEKNLLEVGSKGILDVILQFEKGTVTDTPQNPNEVTFAPKIELEDCQIDWKLPAQTIHNLVRGVNPYPGAWCNVISNNQTKRLKIHITRVQKGIENTPGKIISCDNSGMLVACGQNAINVLELQLEGKKRMTPIELFRGGRFLFIEKI